MNKANQPAAKLRTRAKVCEAGEEGRVCEAGREVLAAVLLAVVVIFWTWQLVIHLSN